MFVVRKQLQSGTLGGRGRRERGAAVFLQLLTYIEKSKLTLFLVPKLPGTLKSQPGTTGLIAVLWKQGRLGGMRTMEQPCTIKKITMCFLLPISSGGLSLGVVVQRGSEVARLVYTATPVHEQCITRVHSKGCSVVAPQEGEGSGFDHSVAHC